MNEITWHSATGASVIDVTVDRDAEVHATYLRFRDGHGPVRTTVAHDRDGYIVLLDFDPDGKLAGVEVIGA